MSNKPNAVARLQALAEPLLTKLAALRGQPAESRQEPSFPSEPDELGSHRPESGADDASQLAGDGDKVSWAARKEEALFKLRNFSASVRERLQRNRPPTDLGGPGAEEQPTAGDAPEEAQVHPVKSRFSLGAFGGVSARLPWKKARPTAVSSDEGAEAEQAKIPSGALPVLLHLDNNREVVCLVHKNGEVTRDSSVVPGASYLVFAFQDVRYKSAPVSHSKALATALEDQGQAVRLVNRSADLGAFYTRPVDQMPEYAVLPGAQAMDMLLKQDGLAKDFPRVVGMTLGDLDGTGTAVVVLYYYDDAGEVGRPQISINPQSLEFALAQFAAARKVDLEQVPVTLYDATRVRKAFKKSQPYLDEDLYLGKTKGTWLGYGVALSALAVVGSVGGGGYYFTRVELAERAAAEASETAQRLVGERRSLLLRSTQSLGAAYAVDGVKLLEAAEALWAPGYSIDLETDRTGTPAINVVAKLSKDVAPDDRKALMDALATAKPPAGCVKENMLISGGLGEAKVTFKCSNPNRAPDAYRPR